MLATTGKFYECQWCLVIVFCFSCFKIFPTEDVGVPVDYVWNRATH